MPDPEERHFSDEEVSGGSKENVVRWVLGIAFAGGDRHVGGLDHPGTAGVKSAGPVRTRPRSWSTPMPARSRTRSIESPFAATCQCGSSAILGCACPIIR